MQCEAFDENGIYVYPSGSIYIGSIQKSKANGNGLFKNKK